MAVKMSLVNKFYIENHQNVDPKILAKETGLSIRSVKAYLNELNYEPEVPVTTPEVIQPTKRQNKGLGVSFKRSNSKEPEGYIMTQGESERGDTSKQKKNVRAVKDSYIHRIDK